MIRIEVGQYFGSAPGVFAGYTRHGDRLGPLPAGATLNPTTGVFTWQPGPAQLGSFLLEFRKTATTLQTWSAVLTFRLGDVVPVEPPERRIRRHLHRP